MNPAPAVPVAKMVVLEVSGLTTVLPNGVPVVRNVSFSVSAGEVLALVGESGCGKSMTALSVMGLLPQGMRVTGGSVQLAGLELVGMSERQMRLVRGEDAAMIYQEPMTALNPVMRVGAQIAEGLVSHGMPRPRARRRTAEILDRVGLPADRAVRGYAHQFSGGMRQRAMIAIALAARPRLLIADEPTTALDVTIQQQILALVEGLRRETDLAVVWITHDLGVVARVAARVAVMYAGKIVESGPTERLFAGPQHPYTAGLLRALPPMRGSDRPLLAQIDGLPPDPSEVPTGCPFAPRCPQRIAQCVDEDPPLTLRAGGLSAACWVPPERWAT